MWDELLTPVEEVAEATHVWAVAEVKESSLARVSYELVGAARDLADLLAVRTEAVLIGSGVGGLADLLVWRGADAVHVLDDDRLAIYEAAGELLGDVPIELLPHPAFKERVRSARAVIRTGEFTPYANIILVAGVVF